MHSIHSNVPKMERSVSQTELNLVRFEIVRFRSFGLASLDRYIYNFLYKTVYSKLDTVVRFPKKAANRKFEI